MSTLQSRLDIRSDQIITKTWRIIDTDNFDGDYPNEQFVAIGIRSEFEAESIALFLNKHAGKHASRYYRVEPHIEISYKLQPGFEP